MEEFIPGQRWISNTELQMGLGCIIESDHRTVTINFAASDETRTYAKENAPLSRIIYSIGEQIQSVDGKNIKITAIQDIDGLIFYSGKTLDGEKVALTENQLDHAIQLNRPSERLFSGQIDKNHWFDLRCQTLNELNKLTQSQLSGLIGCRTSLIPHQLYIAHEVANRHAPRVLLADEVGLGKTIEAGLIIHHQLLNERAQRVLIIVPESLIHQWLVEMLRRFNLMFSIFDDTRCQAMKSNNTSSENIPEENPFLSEQLVLCSVEFLSKNNDDYQHVLSGEWDLMVVDEAHHLKWTAEQSSHEYQLIEQLSQQIKGVLLLTATPEQLGIESHFARLRLLDPDRFTNLDSFIAQETDYQLIARLIEALLSDNTFDQASQQQLKSILKDDYNDEKQHSKESIIEHLLDRHGTGRILFRNTRATIKGFPERKVFTHPQKLPAEYKLLLVQFTRSFIAGNQHEHSITTETEQNFSKLVLFPEQLYQINAATNPLLPNWTKIDPRVQWLGDWLYEQRSNSTISRSSFSADSSFQNNKVLIITAYAQTTIELAETLKKQFGLYAAVFHEGLSLVERDRAAAFFADTENGAQVLICSEIGSEGRNFQFAHKMVLFDLPINPDLLEQRIGRLDRIGQTQNIQIHIPYLDNSAQALLFHWYHEALNAFEKTCPAGHNVFSRVKESLFNNLMSVNTEKETTPNHSDFITHSRILHKEFSQTLHEGRDQLLEYNSCRQPQADHLYTLAEKKDHDQSLFQYMDEVFDAFGIDHSEHSNHCYIISPGEHMLTQFPGLPDDGMTITYSRDIALSNEDMQFFSWEHPMVRTAMDMINSSEMGNTAMTTLDSSTLNVALKPGSLLVECFFVLETTTHKTLYANRYLPPTTIRILLSEHGQELTQTIKHEEIKQGQEKINTQTAQQIIKIKQEELQQIISKAESRCEQYTPKILQSAKDDSQIILNNEIDRLRALSKVNPNIRHEEIDFLQQQLQALEAIFSSIKPRLDALRVIIAS
ncbi:MAG: RNA polymerase-associated protein RapA [gamma proteobacterium symbiont of Taylorina sp.]|nr:RNA polymerase-associated protein RapA [gamma proteobacterium symbiont of Taylorina sp.]